MKNNKSELQKQVFNSLFDTTSQNNFVAKEQQILSIEKEIVKEDIQEFRKRTYNIPVDVLDTMKKIVYMDRDLNNNTELIIKALRSYFDLEEVKILLKEYDKIKGVKKNDR